MLTKENNSLSAKKIEETSVEARTTVYETGASVVRSSLEHNFGDLLEKELAKAHFKEISLPSTILAEDATLVMKPSLRVFKKRQFPQAFIRKPPMMDIEPFKPPTYMAHRRFSPRNLTKKPSGIFE